jgi:hypothetical protein
MKAPISLHIAAWPSVLPGRCEDSAYDACQQHWIRDRAEPVIDYNPRNEHLDPESRATINTARPMLPVAVCVLNGYDYQANSRQ